MADKTLKSISLRGFGILDDKYVIRNISRFSNQKVSIIGDSIETFTGYIPTGYATYYPKTELGITTVDDCWWQKLIDISNTTLEVNASYSGGRVTNTGSGASFYGRVSLIGSPDTILVALGVNDSYYNVPLGDYDFETAYTSLSEATFRTAYTKGIKALKTLYPNADIICIAKIMSDEYKNSIRKIADTLSVNFIDASNYNAPDSTGVHPDKLGMNQIASSVMYLSTLNIGETSENVNDICEELINFINQSSIQATVCTNIKNGVFNSNGQEDSSSSLKSKRLITDFLPVLNNNLLIKVGGSASFSISTWGYTTNDPTIIGTSLGGWKTINETREINVAVPSEVKYLRLTIAAENKTDDIKPEDIKYIGVYTPFMEGVVDVLKSDDNKYKYTNMEQGTFTENGTNANEDAFYYLNRIRSIGYIPVKPGSTIQLSYKNVSGSGTVYNSISYYSVNDYITPRISAEPFSSNNPASFTIPDGVYFIRLLFKYANDGSITISDVNDIVIKTDVSIVEMAAELAASKFASPNYMTCGLLGKVNLNLNLLGKLTYLQSFCIYNGKYYSTDGENIGVQASDFTSEQTVAISVGHGNSMQVGTLHPNYAYISGWDVQKIFVVNLDTLTIVEEIALPTTGYTTCAVDDVSGIAYIFQRDNYPSSEDYYNFIAYDYQNTQELYRKKISRPFAAMQACDFYEGKIIVLNGLGTNSAPNYILMYNTVGDIIGEFFFPSINSQELEGIYINRNEDAMCLSVQNKNIYKITRKS